MMTKSQAAAWALKMGAVTVDDVREKANDQRALGKSYVERGEKMTAEGQDLLSGARFLDEVAARLEEPDDPEDFHS